jgi:hypothetical protein
MVYWILVHIVTTLEQSPSVFFAIFQSVLSVPSAATQFCKAAFYLRSTKMFKPLISLA